MNESLKAAKTALRKEILGIRKNTDPCELLRMGCGAVSRLLDEEEWKKAGKVCVYISIRGEVPTDELIRCALSSGKRVFAPKVCGADLRFIEINGMSELKPGFKGIPEPDSGGAEDSGGALMILPGCAFDESGNRLGYGGGFYDRYLEAHPDCKTAALSYDFAVLPQIPSGDYDRKCGMIVTEKRTIRRSNMNLQQIGRQGKAAAPLTASLGTAEKNAVLLKAADLLEERSAEILAANAEDIAAAKEKQMPAGLLDRLKLTEERIRGMAEGLRTVAMLDDPIGNVKEFKKRPNGLMIGKMTVPIGVIGVIYEARPNVTSDVFALCFKTGNAAILKGGSDAVHSNICITNIIRCALEEGGAPKDALQLIEDTSRETAREFMHLDEYVDLMIPRGGAGLISTVVRESTIPVIETGTGNCHVYVDEHADIEMAVNIINNAKTSRIGVCNAEESLVVHEKIAPKLLPVLEKKLKEHSVELRADESAARCLKNSVPATEEDWGKEYLDYILSIKTVSDIDEAIAHINRYNTGHSEAIVTEDYSNAQKFLREVDAACVYVNASTRFTDGFEFGFGAEIGISTQKLHARGPMGLEALTTGKYIIYGSGQVRE